MDDAQSPPDADNDKGDRARRALRLRDAESVASMRRDMFGDGSLLGGSPPVPDDTDSPVDAAAPPDEGPPLVAPDGSAAVPEDTEPPADQAPPPAESETARLPEAGADEPHADPAFDRVAAGPAMAAPLADIPQSLDAIIDSFPAEAITDGPERPDQGATGPTFLAPLLFSSRSAASGAGDQRSDEPPMPPPEPMQVSAIFNGLDAAEDAARAAEIDESPHTPATLDVLPQQDDAQEAEVPPSEGAAESRDPIQAISEDRTSAAEAMEPPPEVQDDRRHLIEEAAPENGPPAAAEGDASREVQAGLRHEPEPPLPLLGGFPAFPQLPGMPSFPEPVQPAAGPPIPEPPQAAVAPPFPAPAEATAPPFPEPQRSSFREPLQPAPFPRYPEPLERPPFPEARQVAAFPQIEPPSPRHVLDAAAEVSDEATARIAAEATATAEALENLNRMLAQNVPEPRVAAPVWPTGNVQERSVRADPAPFPSPAPFPASRAPDLPLPVPPEPSRAKGIYLFGFLTGLGLSLMAGVALYVLINTV